MEKFNKKFNGYDPKEVNEFFDSIIGQVEKMVIEKNKDKDAITELQKQVTLLQEQNNRYRSIETSLNRSIVAAQDSGEQIRRLAKQESDMVIDEARKNANRIVNDALLRAQKTEYEISVMRKNAALFKKKLRSNVETVLDVIDDIEVLDLE